MTGVGWNRKSGDQRGQTIPLLALLIVAIILFIGLAIDFGFAYVTRAKLSKAVDAAALAGIRNVTVQGETQAKAIAKSSFDINYGSMDRDANPPAVTMGFINDPSGAKFLNVNAAATINTFFIKILPQWRTLTVTARAQARRAPLVMSLVLDVSGSMDINGGANALAGAVGDFVDNFDDDIDRVSMVTFATGHKTNVGVRRNFKAMIHSNAGGLAYGGGTFSLSGFQDAKSQNDLIVDPNVTKVVVFFTDGWANMNQDLLSCSNNQLIYGGCSPPELARGWCRNWSASTVLFYRASDGNGNADPQRQVTCNSAQFPSKKDGRNDPLNMTYISEDAMYRTEQLANTLRSQGTFVYAIGLGDTADVIREPFLNNLANVPAADTFNPSQPQGAVVIVPTADQLDAAFQRIAQQILFRLTQ